MTVSRDGEIAVTLDAIARDLAQGQAAGVVPPDALERLRACVARDGGLEAVAQRLAESRRCEHIEAQNQALKAINAVAQVLTQTSRTDETLGVALSHLLRLMKYDCGAVYVRDGDGPALRLAVRRAPPDVRWHEPLRILPGEGDVGLVAERRESMVVRPEMSVEGGGLAAIACTPLRGKTGVLGVLKVGSHSATAFPRDELEFLESLGAQLGVALESAHQIHTISEQALRLGRRANQLATLLETSDMMAAAVELEGALQACGQRIAEVLDLPRVIVVLDEGEGLASVAAIIDQPADRRLHVGIRLPWRELPLHARTLERAEVIVVGLDSTSLEPEERDWMAMRELETSLLVPLISNRQVRGVLTVSSRESRAFFASELDFCRTIANQIAIAVERSRLFDEVREVAHTLEQRVEQRTRDLREANLRLREISRQRSDFLSVISHELHTPLNAILGFSDVMADENTVTTAEEMREYSRHIHESGRNLLRLINDIIDLARPRAALEDLHVERLRPHVVARGVLDIIRQQAVARRVRLQNDVDAELPTVLAERTRFKQILYNLLSNAVKFSPPDGVVTVGARHGGERVVIWVEDQGPGIPSEQQESIFEPFYQADLSLSRSFEGAGLGLALARRYVRQHGGDLVVHSQIGEGSRFEFSLAVAEGTSN